MSQVIRPLTRSYFSSDESGNNYSSAQITWQARDGSIFGTAEWLSANIQCRYVYIEAAVWYWSNKVAQFSDWF